eukprot:m.301629 g.301629  ORF g.301629 m.301629 type:complete len:213 (-) comp22996_c1_seq2:85-723(-)
MPREDCEKAWDPPPCCSNCCAFTRTDSPISKRGPRACTSTCCSSLFQKFNSQLFFWGRSTLDELLDEDEDLFLMNLSRIWEDKDLLHQHFSEVEALADDTEQLLETYLVEVGRITAKLLLLQQRITNTESLVALKMDVARNRLLLVSTLTGIISACLGFGAVVTGIFGMNLTSNVEDDHRWFVGTVICVAVLIVLFFILTVFCLLKFRMLIL